MSRADEAALRLARAAEAVAGRDRPGLRATGSGVSDRPFPSIFCDLAGVATLAPHEVWRIEREFRSSDADCARAHILTETERSPTGELRIRALWAETDAAVDTLRARVERAQERHPRRVARDLELGTDRPDGHWLWSPRGATLLRVLERWIDDLLLARGFRPTRSEATSAAHDAVFAARPRGWEDAPLRISEWVDEPLPHASPPGVLSARPVTRRLRASVFTMPRELDAERQDLLELVSGIARAVEVSVATESVPDSADAEVRFRIRDRHGAPSRPFASVRQTETRLTVATGRGSGVPALALRATLPDDLEELAAAILESTAGALPLWLAPVEVRVLSFMRRAVEGARSVHDAVLAAGLRAELDVRTTKIQAKERDAVALAIPITLVVGERETDAGAVVVRRRERFASPVTVPLPQILEELRDARRRPLVPNEPG